MNRLKKIESLDEAQKCELLELYKHEWWSKDRTADDVDAILANSLAIALVEKESNKLVAFSRVVTDRITYAFILDVIVDRSWRKQSIGKNLMEAIFSHPELEQVEKFELKCLPELVSFYEKCGFTLLKSDLILMTRKKEALSPSCGLAS